MKHPEANSHFDSDYYATGCGEPYRRDEIWMNLFSAVAERIVSEIAPASVLDAGCAIGLLVEQLRARGVDAAGVDISEYAIGSAHESIRAHVRVGSAAAPLGRRYDLIVCIEVLEHMGREEAEAAVANFCAHSDDVLFSSSPLDHKEPTHFNVNPPEYWAYLFARQSFYRDVDFDASFLTPWAARFRRRPEPLPRIVRDYERRFWELWQANVDLRQLALEQRAQLIAAEGGAAAGAEAAACSRRLEAELSARAAQVADLEQRARWLEEQSRAARAALAAVENGRLMRLLRLLRRSR